MTAAPTDITDNTILNGRMRLLQPKRGHRFGHDAILLAAASPAMPGQRVADLGAGVGAASLALLARVHGIAAVLVEIEPALAALAAENIARNGLAAQARAVALDVAAPEEDFARAGAPAGSFDLVLMNPPFNDAALQASPDPARRRAHKAAPDTLRLWLATASRLLRPQGILSLIWRADAMDKVLEALAGDFDMVTILPVHPAPAQDAIRILVNAVKNPAVKDPAVKDPAVTTARQKPRILPGLALADHARQPAIAAEAVLRAAAPLAVLSARATGTPISPAVPDAPPATTIERKP